MYKWQDAAMKLFIPLRMELNVDVKDFFACYRQREYLQEFNSFVKARFQDKHKWRFTPSFELNIDFTSIIYTMTITVMIERTLFRLYINSSLCYSFLISES